MIASQEDAVMVGDDIELMRALAAWVVYEREFVRNLVQAVGEDPALLRICMSEAN